MSSEEASGVLPNRESDCSGVQLAAGNGQLEIIDLGAVDILSLTSGWGYRWVYGAWRKRDRDEQDV